MILSTSGTNKQIKKIMISYILISILTIIFDRIYAMFSHGVSSSCMNFMFLYPLIGSALIYFPLKNLKFKNLRLSFNFYNTGLAILTIGSLLRGIFQIAGTSSDYTIYYSILGWSLTLISFFIIIIKLIKKYFTI